MMIDFSETVWWVDKSSLLLGALVLLFAASLATRQWGLRIRRLARRRSRGWRDDAAIGKNWLERLADEFVRFLGNTALVAGVLVMAILLVGALRPSAIAPYDPDARGRFMMVIDGENVAAPYPPSTEFILGSDLSARDLLSRIVYGTRGTLGLVLAIALFRITIGATLGGLAGWKRGVTGQQVLSFSSVSSSIPALLFALIFIVAIGPEKGFGVFVLGLGLTGWAELTNLINGAVRLVRAQPYMESAIALGSTPLQLMRRHLLPNLAPALLPAMALEIGAVLLMLGELGFLGVFVGKRYLGIIAESMPFLETAEWAGMLAGTRLAAFTWWWLPIIPAATFLVVIMGFSLLAVGLRGWLDPFESRQL